MNEIISELTRMKCLDGIAGVLNMVYFYIQAFGKDLRGDLEELAKAMGQECCILFDKMNLMQNKSYADSFEFLLEKNRPLGKPFRGGILIDFTGMELDEKLAGFVEYLARNKDNFSYIFTMKDSGAVEWMERLLKQHFCIRSVKASLYTADEQYRMVQEEIARYKEGNIELALETEQENLIREKLENCEWETTDQVLFLIKNAMAGAVYESVLEDNKTNLAIDGKFIDKMFSELGARVGQQQRRYRMGFSIGGFEYE